MKYIRIIFIILTIIWMITVFAFSSQRTDESNKTSSFLTGKVVSLLYGNNLNKEELNLKIEKIDPIIRKIAHYTLYLIGGVLITVVVFTYSINTKRKIAVSQSIGSFYSITDEIHQYFVPRKKYAAVRCNY